MKKVQEFQVLAVVLALPMAYVCTGIWIDWQSELTWSITTVAKLPVILGCLFGSWVCWDLSRRRPSEQCTRIELLKLWRIYTPLGRVSKPVDLLEKYKSNFVKEQEEFLSWCLETNAGTKYSDDYNLGEIRTVGDLIERHPLTTYAHYSSYVDRCLKGETNVLCSSKYPIDFFAWTSGTSGKNKVYPYNWPLYLKGLSVSNTLMTTAVNKSKSKRSPGCIQPVAVLAPTHITTKSEAGVDCSSIGTRSIPTLPEILLPFPKIVYNIHSEDEFYYVALVFALRHQLQFLVLALAPSTLTMFKLLEREWQNICNDIENGKLSCVIDLADDLRSSLDAKLDPNPARAIELRTEFRAGMQGIVHRVWPDVEFATCILSGSFSNYRKSLSLFLEGVVMYSNIHGSTEGVHGVNMWPRDEDVKYMLVPGMSFYEFIPENGMTADCPTTVLSHQVEIGNKYEIVITNPHGFYRYRLGDVIKIVGFEGQIPVYHFMYRSGQMLNALWEKTPECAFMDAIEKTVCSWSDDRILKEYTATESFYMIGVQGFEDTREDEKFYVVFVEVATNMSDSTPKLSNDEKQNLDTNLRRSHELYDVLRKDGHLKQMVVLQVKEGVFGCLKGVMCRDNERASSAQFKMPRVQRNKKYLGILMDSLV